MSDVKTWRERAADKRRKAAVARAVAYLNEGLVGQRSIRKGTAEKRIRASAQPMSTAKALVKGWRGRRRASAAEPPVDDRAAMIRAAYAMELGHGWSAGHGTEAAVWASGQMSEHHTGERP